VREQGTPSQVLPRYERTLEGAASIVSPLRVAG